MRKSTFKIPILLFVMLTSCVIYPGTTNGQTTTVGFQVFYDELSPYGQWVDYSSYGYVWIPDSGADFAPYSTNGHWILTNYGWTWASDYSWGWATFHYGRWSFNDSFGWFWVPDNEWGPAWVNWRQADGYYGWEPMQPGMTLSMSFDMQYDNHNDHWLFVSNRDFERTDIHHYYVNRTDHDRIVRNSTIIRNTYNDASHRTTYVSGPSRNDVQNRTGRTVVPMTIKESRKPGQQINNGQMNIYRPQINKTSSGKNITPRKVTNLNDVKKPNGRDATIQQNQTPTRQPNSTNQQDNQPAKRPNVENPQRKVEQPVQPQNRTTQPVIEGKIQSVEPPISTPADNNRQERQQNIQPARDNTPQPTPQRNINQQDNIQQRNTPPTNNVNKSRPEQPQNVNPTNNRQTPVRQSKTINQEIKKEQAKEPDKVTNERK